MLLTVKMGHGIICGKPVYRGEAEMALHAVTMAEIAKMAGVSKTTVSLILNGKAGKISKATVEKVEQLIQRQGYTPNHAARSLYSGKTKIIAHICGSISERLFSKLIDETEARGYHLMSLMTKWNLKREMECVEAALACSVDGMIVGTGVLQSVPALRKKVLKRKMPVVVFGGEPGDAFPYVEFDYGAGLAQAFRELRAKGHRMTVLLRWSDPKKFDAYSKLCPLFGYEPLALRFEDENPGGMPPPAICDELMRLRPDALIVEGAGECVEIIGLLKGRGVSIPSDMSVICYDGCQWIEHIGTPVAIIDYDVERKAAMAVESLFASIEGRPHPFASIAQTLFRRPECVCDRRR